MQEKKKSSVRFHDAQLTWGTTRGSPNLSMRECTHSMCNLAHCASPQTPCTMKLSQANATTASLSTPHFATCFAAMTISKGIAPASTCKIRTTSVSHKETKSLSTKSNQRTHMDCEHNLSVKNLDCFPVDGIFTQRQLAQSIRVPLLFGMILSLSRRMLFLWQLLTLDS